MDNSQNWPVLRLKHELHRSDAARLQPSRVLHRRRSDMECTVFVKHAPLSRLQSADDLVPQDAVVYINESRNKKLRPGQPAHGRN